MPVGPWGVPGPVLADYRRAAEIMAPRAPGCGLDWAILAGIGRIESGHASGGRVDAAGTTRGRILGPRLDGRLPGTAVVRDSDGGALDGDALFDRATGPMQFLPGTWRGFGADGNDDGVTNPNNVYDAALAAARYLCAGGGDLRERRAALVALFRYNRSTPYGLDVLAWAQVYRTGVRPLPGRADPVPAPAPVPAAPPPVVLAAEDEPDRPATPVSSQPAATTGGPDLGATGTGTVAPPEQAALTSDAPAPSETEIPPAPATTGGTSAPSEPSGTPEPTATPAEPTCAPDPVVLEETATSPVPDGTGLLLRLTLSEPPEGCGVVAATLRLDPGAAADGRALAVARVTDPWSDAVTSAPATAGPVVGSAPASGPRSWEVRELVAALLAGNGHGFLVELADGGPPVAWAESAGLPRLLVTFG
ncbi:MAG: lytic transglycosylase domain-containing protein [Pseudonocardia sp.]